MDQVSNGRSQFLNYFNQTCGGNKTGAAYLEALRHEAPTNPYAKEKLQTLRRDEIGIESSKGQTAEAWADFHGAAAEGTNLVGDVLTLGAHRNVGEAYNAAREGDLKKFAAESGKFGLKVTAGALLKKPSALGTLVKEAGVGTVMLTEGKSLVPVARALYRGGNFIQKSEKLHTAVEVAHHGHQGYEVAHKAYETFVHPKAHQSMAKWSHNAPAQSTINVTK
jgi:hypothetical protein